MPKPLNDQWLIKLMRELGYKTYYRGMCFGLAYMTMQAVLAGELDKFNDRINLLRQYKTPSKLKSDLQKIKDKIKKREPLNVHERKLIEIPAFFDGVELYQQGGRYPELFGENKFRMQTETPILPLVQPKKFGINNGILHAQTFVNIVAQEELTQFLLNLEKIAKTHTQPTSIVLSATLHDINISYLPKKGWFFIDPTDLRPKKAADVADLAVKLMEGFRAKSFGQEKLCLSYKLYLKDTQDDAIKSLLNKLSALNEKLIKKINPDYIDYEDLRNNKFRHLTWINVAAREGQTSLVAKLMKYAPARFKELALETATMHQQLDVFKLLLNNLAKNNAFLITHSFLLAARHNCVEILQFLFRQKNLCQKIPIRKIKEALFQAIEHGNIAVVKLMVKQGVSLTIANRNGKTPLYEAAERGDLTLVKYFLEEQQISHLTKDKEGNNLLIYAALSGHKELLNYLLDTFKIDIHHRNNKNKSLIEVLVKNHQHFHVPKLLEMVDFLLSKGVNIGKLKLTDFNITSTAAKKYGYTHLAKMLAAQKTTSSTKHTLFEKSQHDVTKARKQHKQRSSHRTIPLLNS